MVDRVADRRQRLLDALVTIVAERGLDQVSIREVAAAADVSIGTVQYYCRSKDEMLRMAWEHVVGRIIARAGGVDHARLAAGEAIRRLVLELLPLDEERRTEGRVYLAFAARAAVSPVLAEVQNRLLVELRTQLTAAFQRAKDTRQAGADLDPALAASTTAALVDGVLLHHLTDPAGMPEPAIREVLEAHLARYLATSTSLAKFSPSTKDRESSGAD